MKRQRGFLSISNGELAVALIVVAVLGWGVIECLRWLASHISVSFVG